MLLSFLMLYTCILFVKINYISERTLRFVVSMYKHVKTKWRRKTFTSTCIHGPDPLHRRLPTGDRVFCLKDAITHEYPTMDPPLDSRMNTNITYLKFSPMQRTLHITSTVYTWRETERTIYNVIQIILTVAIIVNNKLHVGSGKKVN